MTNLKPLNHKHLRRSLSASHFKFKNTSEIKILSDLIGQPRALDALLFGVDIKSKGYNLYAMGPPGIGKRSLIKKVLTEQAEQLPAPFDWCYVYNFATPDKPIVLKLRRGHGSALQQDMQDFIHEISSSVLTLFESDQYRARLNKIHLYYDRKRNERVDKTSQFYKVQHIKEKNLKRKTIASVIKPEIKRLRKKYAKYKQVLKYLTAVDNDIINHVDDFIAFDEKTNLLSFSLENPGLTRYKVNVFVDNKKNKTAPVVFEENPNYSNLICRIEYMNIQGAPTTNFMHLKAGSLHRANGGYLVLEARKIKKHPETWEILKSILYAGKITIRPAEQDSRFIKPVSIEPMSIPLNVKVILIGSRSNYYLFCDEDPDFIRLFKVPVDFDEQIQRNNKNINLYARLLAKIIQQNSLLTFHATAVAEIIDYSTRLAEDIEKLSTHFRTITDLVLEADYWTRKNNRKIVRSSDVQYAIHARIHRMDRSREIYYEEIQRDFVIINTMGKVIGQINALSVRRVGDFSYGHPTRVTARVRVGKGKIIDIQRKIKMAGPFHSKAILTITSFLASFFDFKIPFALSASISYEQIYVWTEGDSASVAELCTLLSAIAQVPLQQNLAITGSIDQYGEVQAVGGVNEKIEGFFDVCKAKGLTGKQGVLIPAVNQTNLMLREDVVEAAKAGKFSIYCIRNINEAIEKLTGMIAGERDKSGFYPEGTLYHLIEKRLHEFASTRKLK